MPIRTHRGRAAVYRRLWGWPLRSPKHLVATLIAMAAVLAAVGFLLPEQPQNRQVAAARPTSAASSGESTVTTKASPPSFSVPPQPPPSVPPDPAGLAVVEAWGKAWVNHPPGMSQQQWLDGLRPYTTDEFLPGMSTVDPANAGSAVTGSPQAVSSTPTSMVVRLPTDVGELVVTVNKTPQGWRVAGYDKDG